MRTAHVLTDLADEARGDRRDAVIVVLGEVVAELAERIELLETREQLSRVRNAGRKQAPRGGMNKAQSRGEMAERLKATVC